MSNGNSFSEKDARWLPWVFRAGLPGFQGGWPA